jgi:hypothetical protein
VPSVAVGDSGASSFAVWTLSAVNDEEDSGSSQLPFASAARQPELVRRHPIPILFRRLIDIRDLSRSLECLQLKGQRGTEDVKTLQS